MTSGNHTCENSGRRRYGFTIVETVMVMTIIGIMASIALPRYAGFVAREQVGAAARRVVTDLALARRLARTTSASRSVVFDAAAGTYTLGNISDPDRHARAYQVSLADEPYRARIVSASFGAGATIIFDGYGTPDSGGTVVIAVGKYQETVAVDNGTGRARVAGPIIVDASQ